MGLGQVYIGQAHALPTDLGEQLGRNRADGPLDRETDALADCRLLVIEAGGGDQNRESLGVEIGAIGRKEGQQPGRPHHALTPFGGDEAGERFAQGAPEPILPFLFPRFQLLRAGLEPVLPVFLAGVDITAESEDGADDRGQRCDRRAQACRQADRNLALAVVLDLLPDQLLTGFLAVEPILRRGGIGCSLGAPDHRAKRIGVPHLKPGQEGGQNQEEHNQVEGFLRTGQLRQGFLPINPTSRAIYCILRAAPVERKQGQSLPGVWLPRGPYQVVLTVFFIGE